MSSTCQASVRVASFTMGGEIAFEVETGDCTDSDGRFEYTYSIESDGVLTTSSRRVTWARTHDSSTVTVEDAIVLSSDETLVGVTVSSSECNCH